MEQKRKNQRRFALMALSLGGCLLSSCGPELPIESSSDYNDSSSISPSSSETADSSFSASSSSSIASSSIGNSGLSSSESSFSDSDDLDYSYICFGTERYRGTNQSGDVIFDANGLNISSISSDGVFFDAKEEKPMNALRIGSSEDSGMLNISFEEPVQIQNVYLMAFVDNQSVNVNCATSSFSRSYSVKQSNPVPLDDFDYLSSSWASFPMNGAATSFLSISSSDGGNNIFFLSKIVIVGKDGGGSSGETSSESSESSSSSSYESSAEQVSHILPDGAYRLPRVKVNGNTADIYQINELSGGTYSCTIAKTITKGEEYFEPEDVAAYYQAFDSFPVNYCYGTSSKVAKNNALSYGKNGRCYFKYSYGNYHQNDYTPPLGPWSKTGTPYYELDISTKTYNPKYNTGKAISRGIFRIVILPAESSTSYPNENGYDSICFFTRDHYDSFVEYRNFYEGWSESFVGANGEKNQRPTLATIPLF